MGEQRMAVAVVISGAAIVPNGRVVKFDRSLNLGDLVDDAETKVVLIEDAQDGWRIADGAIHLGCRLNGVPAEPGTTLTVGSRLSFAGLEVEFFPGMSERVEDVCYELARRDTATGLLFEKPFERLLEAELVRAQNFELDVFALVLSATELQRSPDLSRVVLMLSVAVASENCGPPLMGWLQDNSVALLQASDLRLDLDVLARKVLNRLGLSAKCMRLDPEKELSENLAALREKPL